MDFVVGRGPDKIPTLPIWGAPKVDCALFRNESVLRPLFGVWPEDVADVPFQYCCEYQPGGASSGFQLRNYTNAGILQPAPYHDLGIVDKDSIGYNLLHWKFWGLPTKQFSVSMLYCDVTDLQRLYNHRLWKNALVRGIESFAIIFGVVFFLILVLKYCQLRVRVEDERERERQRAQSSSASTDRTLNSSSETNSVFPTVYQILKGTSDEHLREALLSKLQELMSSQEVLLSELKKQLVPPPAGTQAIEKSYKEELLSDCCHILPAAASWKA